MTFIPRALEPWLLALLVPYLAITLILVACVIDVLRPRTDDLLAEANSAPSAARSSTASTSPRSRSWPSAEAVG